MEPGIVQAVHVPPGPSRATALGTLGPLTQHPLGHAEQVDDVWGECGARPFLGCLAAEDSVLGDEERVLDLGWVGVARQDQKLDGDGFPEPSEALDPLQAGGGPTVFERSTLHGDVLLQCGHREVAIENVAALGSLYGQVVAVMFDPAVAALLDVDVGRTHWNSHNVVVSISGGKEES